MSNSNNQVVDVLNKQLANWNILFVKLHNFHWYVKGEQFFTLHERFEEYYNESATYVDDLAERILTLQGNPLATMKEYLATATIQEATGKETPKDMVASIKADFETVIAELKAGMDVAQGAEDEASSDMLLGIKGTLEKHVWMLRAFLA
ncbi:DNA starvation/stationary phase protection protein [Paenibacillus selenitireducens]|uniref:DNA starvation/stationary phase protection protein n=1 Tax=Paenibacillus selenitireducens TaxID=1324314 RepID=A0A1T2XK94_9BACL|nr:DNA starvation/stationary phase protection protein [Paenibacillus selenitireducens]OPA80289.1 DNA starvation/stationary phase protection protein [Paenibacillus selenitireducens]